MGLTLYRNVSACALVVALDVPLHRQGQARALAADLLLTNSKPPRGLPSTCLSVRVLVEFQLSVARVMHQLSSLAAAPATLNGEEWAAK